MIRKVYKYLEIKRALLFFLLVISMISLNSCVEDDDIDPDPTIIGDYIGSLKVHNTNSTSFELFENESLNIFRITSNTALIDFNKSSTSVENILDYEGDIINNESIIILETETANGEKHAGQASLSDLSLTVLIKNSDTGQNILEYHGTKK